MNVSRKWCGRALAVILLPCFAVTASRTQAQEQHVVSTQELSKDASQPAQTRDANEAALRQLFSSAQAQQALESANINYRQVDKAIGQVSDEDLAKLAARSREVQNNFAGGRAGSLSDRDLLIIVIIALLLILLIAILH